MWRSVLRLLVGWPLLLACSEPTPPPLPSRTPALASLYEFESLDGAPLPVPITLGGEPVTLNFSELQLGGPQLSWSIGYEEGDPPSYDGFWLLASYRLPTRDSLVWPVAPGVEPEFFGKAEGDLLTLVVIPNGEPGSMGEYMGGAHVWTFRARRDE